MFPDQARPTSNSVAVRTGHDRLAPFDGLSYVAGSTLTPLLNDTVPELLAKTARIYGSRSAVIFREQGIHRSWAEFSKDVDELAAGLLANDINKGERVGLWSVNRYEWLVMQYATARIGAVLVSINPAYQLVEVEQAIKTTGMTVLVHEGGPKSPRILQSLFPELESASSETLHSERLPTLRSIIRMDREKTTGMLNFDDIVAHGARADRREIDRISASLSPHEAISIQFTSGTTGTPKGAALTHHNMINNAVAIAESMRFSEQDRLCVPVPLFHCFGMVLSSLTCVSTGASMVFPSRTFNARATMQAVSEERCTALHGVPTMFIAQLDHAEFRTFDFSSLRTGIMSGAPCPLETMTRVVARMNMQDITIAYGMTETGPVSFQSDISDPLAKRVATVGRVLPHLEVKIVDQNGETAKIGERGELCVRGYALMQGYWNDPKRTSRIIRDGWLRTGDIATLDAQGYCSIVGRAKDMVIRGGENIFPREVEEFIFTHPKVQAVQVFGVPSERLGEVVCAWVVLKPGETCTEGEIRAFCNGKIARYKVPRHVRIVNEFPLTASGKPQKFVMREKMVADLTRN